MTCGHAACTLHSLLKKSHSFLASYQEPPLALIATSGQEARPEGCTEPRTVTQLSSQIAEITSQS